MNNYLNRSICLIDRTLTSATTTGHSGPGVMAIKGYSILIRAPEMKPYHQMQCKIIPRTARCLVSLQRIQSDYSKPHQQG